jgi:hypothetical protein
MYYLQQNPGCAIRTDGKRMCWSTSLLGAGPTIDSYVSVAFGGSHACSLREDGKFVCSKKDEFVLDYGQAPAGPSANLYTRVAAGWAHTCAIQSAGGAVTCLGDQTSPTTQAPAGTFKEIAAGGQQTCAIREDDKIVCWGVGPGPATPTFDRFKRVAMSADAVCGIRSDDHVFCW